MKTIKKIITHLPQGLRKHITQSSLDFSTQLRGIELKTAETIEEFEQAFEVLYDSYVRVGFESPNPERKRIIPQFFFPSTAVLIAKVDGVVIGTMSLIRDNFLGLPMESIFDLSSLRADGSRLTEISSLAIHPSYRTKGGRLLHQFIRYMWNYGLDHHGSEKFVIAVNPSMVQLYEDIYLFKKIPQKHIVGNYDFVKGAPAVGLYINATESKLRFKQEYQGRKTSKDLYDFMFNHPRLDCGMYPKITEFYDISSSSSSTILQHFLNSNSNWWTRLDSITKFNFVRSQNALGRSKVQYPGLHISPAQREQARHDSLLKILGTENREMLRVTDVSKMGLKIRKNQVGQEIFGVGKNTPIGVIALKVGPELVIRLKIEQVWDGLLLSGFRVLDADCEWGQFLEYIDLKTNPMNTVASHFKKAG